MGILDPSADGRKRREVVRLSPQMAGGNDGVRCREMAMKVTLHTKKDFVTLAGGPSPIGRSSCIPLPSVAPKRFRSTTSEQAPKVSRHDRARRKT